MPSNEALLNEVQDLVWALIDDQATEEQIRRLEQLLIENEVARRTYITCMQLHADLHYLLGKKRPLSLPTELERQATAMAQKVPTSSPLPLVEMPTPQSQPPSTAITGK